MDHFDYLTYKQKKQQEKTPKKRVYTNREKALATACLVSFALFFVFATIFIATKASKIDIEYGRLGKNPNLEVEIQDEENGEEVTRKEKFTVDKRLFLIFQEEKGPSESKVLKRNTEGDVISNSAFENIKSNGQEYLPKEEPAPSVKTERISASNKVAIKPKLPVNTEASSTQVLVKPVGAFNTSYAPAKVYIGKFATIEEAKSLQAKIIDIPCFIKRTGAYYTLQAGSYDNYEAAKKEAGKLKARGLDAWILQ